METTKIHKILLVSENDKLLSAIEQTLTNEMQLVHATSIQDARGFFGPEIDLVILGVELPDGDGFEFCSEIQTTDPQIPIFFLTCHGDLAQKVLGFLAGADDYITDPFSPVELRARIESRLRKIHLKKHNTSILKWDNLQINKELQEVLVLDGSEIKKINLTSLEFKILLYFAQQPNTVIPRDKVLNDLWGETVYVYCRSVDTHVSKLRKKLGPAAMLIRSVHGAGYKFCPTG